MLLKPSDLKSAVHCSSERACGHVDPRACLLLQAAPEDIATEIETVRSDALRFGLAEGVGFLQDTMNPEDRVVTERLFAAGAIQVCLCLCSDFGILDLQCFNFGFQKNSDRRRLPA